MIRSEPGTAVAQVKLRQLNQRSYSLMAGLRDPVQALYIGFWPIMTAVLR